MSTEGKRAARVIRPFLRDEKGNVTIVFVIWFPLFIILFLTILDFAYAFTVNASMWQQTRVAARGLSMHHLDKAEAEQLIRHGLSWSKKDYAVSIIETRHSVSVRVATPANRMGITNTAMEVMGSSRMAASVSMLKEPV